MTFFSKIPFYVIITTTTTIIIAIIAAISNSSLNSHKDNILQVDFNLMYSI